MPLARFLFAAACWLLVNPSGSLAAERAAPSIYTCKIDGVITFADRPCGDVAEVHSIDPSATNTYEAPAMVPGDKQRTKQSVVQRRVARVDRTQEKRAENCARYARSLKEIRSKMRAGYSAKEGERLRLRQEKLRDSQRSSRCEQ